MQTYFPLKARTTNGDWYSFNICDVPVLIGNNQAVLLGKTPSPILDISVVLRQDIESGLYEGDVFEYEGELWIVCYERGFYAINEEFVIKYLYTFNGELKVIGTADYDISFPVPYKKRKQHLFRYGETLFFIPQIIMKEDDDIVIRIKKTRVPCSKIQQECCMSYNGEKVYLGDVVQGKPVELHGGRICIETENGFLDLATGGVLNGYIPQDVR